MRHRHRLGHGSAAAGPHRHGRRAYSRLRRWSCPGGRGVGPRADHSIRSRSDADLHSWVEVCGSGSKGRRTRVGSSRVADRVDLVRPVRRPMPSPPRVQPMGRRRRTRWCPFGLRVAGVSRRRGSRRSGEVHRSARRPGRGVGQGEGSPDSDRGARLRGGPVDRGRGALSARRRDRANRPRLEGAASLYGVPSLVVGSTVDRGDGTRTACGRTRPHHARSADGLPPT